LPRFRPLLRRPLAGRWGYDGSLYERAFVREPH